MNRIPARRFFLGAQTPSGFLFRMEQLTDPARYDRVVILKGGPGSGKSTLLTRAANAARQAGYDPELICCVQNAASLDAVSFGRTVLIDGTPPHAAEPQHPGAVETLVSLGDCWDEGVLRRQKEEILALDEAKRLLYEQCRRYLAAAQALQSDSYRLMLEITDTDKIRRLAERIARQEFAKGGSGGEQIRFLSAFTADGWMLFSDTAARLAERICLLEDDYGPSSALLLAELRRLALAAGCRVIACPSPMAPCERLESLFLPELSLGFMVKNHDLSPDVAVDRVINARRFTDKEALSGRRRRLAFHKKAVRQMLSQAQALLGEVRLRHRALEALYAPAMDFCAVDRLTQELLERILG